MPRLYIASLLTLLLMPPLIAAPLHYFREDDRVGLKDEAGRVLVSARYPDIGWTVYDEDPQGGEIEFITSIHQPRAADDAPAWAAGDIYDRAGHYLYSPISFDNGMDYWEEGYRRFIEDGKVGFVDGNGRKVIPAQYAAADPFSHGYATVYTGNWRTKWVDGGEHAVLDAVDASAQTHVINQRGEIVTGRAQPLAPQDVKIGGRYYPYPFAHNPFEQHIVAKLNATAALGDLAYYDDGRPRDGRSLAFAITARPSRVEPYYRVSAYEYDRERQPYRNEELSRIVADHDGRLYYRAWGENTLIPLKTWLRDALHEVRTDMVQHRDGFNRFDVERRLRELPLQWF
ncbi:WG repeat-containing protein [Cardiobacterium valvarum]|uniref:MORN repeat protein n=1 Tax=Cardiobacterium valvarum F0432 TaxID=797473 RepID=G9ZJH7_9GAMM|nr:WG repeat-containing protein [Cardiobacterium valvarum]EHM49755.1 hypothetical protein HMPREF9080_02946 [Cardiobacterium valvarum F0432]